MKRIFLQCGWWAVLLVSPALLAESGPRVATPVLGYVYDPAAQAIRAVVGVPGAATAAENVETGGALAAARVHSAAKTAIAQVKDGSWAAVFFDGPVVAAALEPAEVRDVAFSRSGKWAALSDGHTVAVYALGAGRAERIASHHPDGGVARIAVNDAGEVAVATPGGLILRFAGEEARAVAAGGQWSALEFSPDGSELLAADAEHLELVRIDGAGGRTRIAALPAAATALAVSLDGASLAVVLGGQVGTIVSGQLTLADCGCAPGGLATLTGSLVVYLEGAGKILDAESGAPRLTPVTALTGGLN